MSGTNEYNLSRLNFPLLSSLNVLVYRISYRTNPQIASLQAMSWIFEDTAFPFHTRLLELVHT